MKTIEVVAAVIRDSQGRIFATQRGYGEYKDWWEFPGGKLEAGESPEDALKREIREELETEVSVDEFIATVEHDYPAFHLTMHCYWCTVVCGRLELKEHEAARWLSPDRLGSVAWLPADLVLLPMLKITPGLKEYVQGEIIPRYDGFDAAHGRDHALMVIRQSLEIAAHYDVNIDMVYATAAYHDTGLCKDRKTHHLVSGEIIRGDIRLNQWFTPDQIETMAQAAEDHRASSDHKPRSIYGKIVAEADRFIVPKKIIERTIQYGLANYPELEREGHWQRTLDHLREKYGDGGYLKLWFPESPNVARLESLRSLIRDEVKLRPIFDDLFQKLTR